MFICCYIIGYSLQPFPLLLRVDVTFVRADGSKIAGVKGKIGDNLLDVVLNNQVDIDGFGKRRRRSE